MKRLWLGVGVLLGLLAVSLWAMEYAQQTHQSISDILEEAALAVQEENWTKARALQQQAVEQWEKSWSITAALSDHTELDEIDAGFARLEAYCRDGHVTDFAAESGALARQVEALGEGHRLSLSNLL